MRANSRERYVRVAPCTTRTREGSGEVIATDINEYRLNAAEKFGADAVINAGEDVSGRLRQLNEDRLADRVIVCAGSISASKQALQCVDRGGSVLFFAVPERGAEISVPIAQFWRDEVTIMTSYGAAPTDLEDALKLIDGHRVNVHDMITHRLGLAETGLGFRLVAKAKESLKVIIEPQR